MKRWYHFRGLLLLVVAEMERTDRHTHTHTHKTTTVTLAAHARRGLIINKDIKDFLIISTAMTHLQNNVNLEQNCNSVPPSLDVRSTMLPILCMNNHIYSTLFKIQERKSDRRSREIEQRKESQNTHTHKTKTCELNLLH